MLKITIGNRITECNEALRYSNSYWCYIKNFKRMKLTVDVKFNIPINYDKILLSMVEE